MTDYLPEVDESTVDSEQIHSLQVGLSLSVLARTPMKVLVNMPSQVSGNRNHLVRYLMSERRTDSHFALER
jgi:hypothetical protein